MQGFRSSAPQRRILGAGQPGHVDRPSVGAWAMHVPAERPLDAASLVVQEEGPQSRGPAAALLMLHSCRSALLQG